MGRLPILRFRSTIQMSTLPADPPMPQVGEPGALSKGDNIGADVADVNVIVGMMVAQPSFDPDPKAKCRLGHNYLSVDEWEDQYSDQQTKDNTNDQVLCFLVFIHQ